MNKLIKILGISFLITPIILILIIFMFQIDLSIPLDFKNIKEIKLTENNDYNLTINENLNNYTIIINAKHRISYFKYNYVFYDKNKKIIKADTNYVREIAAEEYKSIIIKKPTELMLSEGTINIQYEAYYYEETFLKEKLITLGVLTFISYCISFGLTQCIYISYIKK